MLFFNYQLQLAVILSRNPVHSVLFLMLVYLFSSLIFLILGAEFLAILIIVVYVEQYQYYFYLLYDA
jgi:NADH:ubiquinone oxidoreductase subunit 6 (subunit J)